MAHKAHTARAARIARHGRIRNKVAGSGQRPRVAVYRSLNHIYVQIIDDEQGRTVAQASSIEPDLKKQLTGKNKRQAAEIVGQTVAKRAVDAGVSQAVFDRGGYKYHGRVRALADAARKGGLVF
ncbi:MAG: 50S ribosomal protein L18 [Chloroflexi bacterium]|nr:50S ribosomal protein L18 [Chloroflexota bacterium]